ncbi:MAG: metallophosphatase family protein [Candidatus Eremiobacteraeota bacterium]|nr:metallophosphatase family protein [Candidatus Eremiobacteraeota bacterium]
MKSAIVSDVHSNLESLTAVFEMLAPENNLLCLGDIVGYGPNPNECVQMIRERATATVLGNHDVAVIDGFGIEYFNPAARKAMEWTQTVITEENRQWLNGLSYEVRVPEYLMVHGAPVNYFEYILDKAGAARAFSSTDAPLIFVGHTHIAEYYALDPEGTISHEHMQRGGELKMRDNCRYLVNCGSIGQPRDLNPQAAFALYDSEDRTISFKRYEYEIPAVQEKIRSAALPAMLASRLEVGR